jgi:hypothetical protein
MNELLDELEKDIKDCCVEPTHSSMNDSEVEKALKTLQKIRLTVNK